MPVAYVALQFSHTPKLLAAGHRRKPWSAPGSAGAVRFWGRRTPAPGILAWAFWPIVVCAAGSRQMWVVWLERLIPDGRP